MAPNSDGIRVFTLQLTKERDSKGFLKSNAKPLAVICLPYSLLMKIKKFILKACSTFRENILSRYKAIKRKTTVAKPLAVISPPSSSGYDDLNCALITLTYRYEQRKQTKKQKGADLLKYDSRSNSNADYAVKPHVAMQCDVTSTLAPAPGFDVAPEICALRLL